MSNTWIIFKREFNGYFATPIAYVFMVIFLIMSGIFTFYGGDFFARGQADLNPFFTFHPWLYLVFIPAIGMRLWAEERKTGTIELLFSLPITTFEAVMGKFLAAWLFCNITLMLSFPLWLTVNYLGNPDNGVIFAGYIGSSLMAAGFLAISSCISALSKNQVIAFVLSFIACLMFILSGYPVVLDALQVVLPEPILQTIAGFSFITNFDTIIKGILDVRSIVFFATLVLFWLYANSVLIEYKKAD